MSRRNKWTIVFVAAVAVRLAFYWYTGFIADDAFITFRYARNLAHGLGFVYNPGVRLLGTSAPFFTFVLAVLEVLRITPPHAALLVSVIASGVTAILLYRIACLLRMTDAAFIPALAFILWPRSVVADSSGMETSLFTLLIFASFYYQYRRKGIYALATATVATLTRPEGGFVLVMLLVSNIYRDRERWWRYLLVPGFLIVPWALFAWWYFGSPIPHSIPAKLALYSRFGTTGWFHKLVYVMGWHNPVGWALTIAAVAGAIWLYRKQDFGRLEVVWLLTMFAFYVFSPTRLFFWYVPPVYPVFILLASASVPPLLDRYMHTLTGRFRFLAVTGVAIVLVLSFGTVRAARSYREYEQTLERVHRRAGFYLFANSASDARVAAEDIGNLGYYSQRRILDRDGLVSSEAVPYNRAGKYRELILDYKPDYVGAFAGSEISPFLEDSSFVSEYRLLVVLDSGLISEYRIYEREK